jgi:ABC-type multidrug transport system fused ATPase/permease subunit
MMNIEVMRQMEISAMISALLLLFPGWITIYFIDSLGTAKKRDKDAISTLIRILIAGIIPAGAAILIYSSEYPIKTLKDAVDLISQIKYLGLYLTLSSVLAFLTAFLWHYIMSKLISKMINGLRESDNAANLDDVPVWSKFFDRSENAIVYVYHLSNKQGGVWGILQSSSQASDEDRDLLVIGSTDIEEVKHKLTQVKEAFIDMKTGTVIESYEFKVEELIK